LPLLKFQPSYYDARSEKHQIALSLVYEKRLVNAV